MAAYGEKTRLLRAVADDAIRCPIQRPRQRHRRSASRGAQALCGRSETRRDDSRRVLRSGGAVASLDPASPRRPGTTDCIALFPYDIAVGHGALSRCMDNQADEIEDLLLTMRVIAAAAGYKHLTDHQLRKGLFLYLNNLRERRMDHAELL